MANNLFFRLYKLFQSQSIIEKCKTPYNELEITKQKGHLVLNSLHTNYSYGSLHTVFRKTFRQINLNFQNINKVLVLGFGAGSIAWIFRKEIVCDCSITGVEIDEEIIHLANRYFHLSSLPDIHIQIADAEKFLIDNQELYDLLIVDIFVDHRIPAKFQTSTFLNRLSKHLQANGTILYNFLLYDFKARKQANLLENKFHKTFREIQVLTFGSRRKNKVFIGKRQTDNNS